MSPPSAPLDLERLLQEADWVRGLVARLVGDAHAVDDVVQETWVAALSSGEEVARRRGPAGLRTWLAAVARNLALLRGRSEGTRRWHEARAARPEGTGEADGGREAERLRLHKLLAEELLALEEPYRRAVVLRALDGLSHRALAQRLGIDEAAARQRVHRGLAKLRARLERKLAAEDLPWTGVFAPLLRGGSTGAAQGGGGSAAAALARGLAGVGAAMGTKTVLGGTLAVGAALLVAWSVRVARTGPEPSGGSEGTRPGALAAAAPISAPERAPAAAPDRVPALAPSRAEAGPTREAARPRTDAPAPPAALTLLVRDAGGRALEGARARPEDVAEPLAGASGPDGVLVLPLSDVPQRGERPEGIALVVSCAGHVEARAVLRSLEPCTVVLARLPELSGRVLEPGGPAFAGRGRVRARVVPDVGSEPWEEQAELAAGGRFRFTGLPPGELRRLVVEAEGFAETERLLERRLSPGGREEVVVTLEPGVVVEGRVLDARGAPAPGAFVWARDFYWDEDDLVPSTHADLDGRFRLEGVDVQRFAPGGRERALLFLYARAGSAVTGAAPTALAWRDDGRYEVVLRLGEAGCALRGRVLAADGPRPAEGLLLLGLDADGRVHQTTTDGQGGFRFEELVPGRFDLVSLPLADAETRTVAYGVDLEQGEERVVTLRLAPPGRARLQGRVVDPDGRPLPGAVVSLGGLLRRVSKGSGGVATASLLAGLGERSASADERGAFAFEGLSAGEYRLEATRSPGTAAWPAAADVRLGERERSDGWVLTVGPAVLFAGRLQSAARREADLRLTLAPVPEPPGPALDPAEARPDAQGRFAFEAVPAGRYRLRVLEGEEVLEELLLGPQGAGGLELWVR